MMGGNQSEYKGTEVRAQRPGHGIPVSTAVYEVGEGGCSAQDVLG